MRICVHHFRPFYPHTLSHVTITRGHVTHDFALHVFHLLEGVSQDGYLLVLHLELSVLLEKVGGLGVQFLDPVLELVSFWNGTRTQCYGCTTHDLAPFTITIFRADFLLRTNTFTIFDVSHRFTSQDINVKV